MRLVKTEEAVGQVLCHDMTQIIPGVSKGPRFKKGHIVAAEDIPVLLDMGKTQLYVYELEEGMVHENDAAERLAAICGSSNMRASAPSEGKIELTAACDGVFLVDSERLIAVNGTDEVMIATRKGGCAVREGDKLAGMRVIPLVVSEERLREAEAAAGSEPLMRVEPFKLKTAAIIATGSEVASGRIEDAFTPAVEAKLAGFGISCTYRAKPGDGRDDIVAAIAQARSQGVDLVLCTGGMSVDPDDNTPGAIKASGARIVTYGAPVLPGAMLLVGYYDDGTPVLGLPGCVMYAKATIFDLLLPRIAAGIQIEKRDVVAMGEGGLCLGCKPCTYPHCPFGK
jgi:hypothetical protein